MIKVLAFDVSETLQTGAEHDDNGLGQPMMMGNEIIPDAYSVMVGGTKTAKLLKRAQEKGIIIVLVTNNGSDLDTEVILRTLRFLAGYGVNIPQENYMGPPTGTNGSKVPRLEEILIRFELNKDEIVFFDDSQANVEEAEEAGFNAIRVKTPVDLQNGIIGVINQPLDVDNEPSVIYPYDELDIDFRQYLSSESQQERHQQGRISTQTYWEGKSIEEQEILFANYKGIKNKVASKSSFFNNYDNLPIPFKQFLSETTQMIRYEIGQISTADYWQMLDSPEQNVLRTQFDDQSTLYEYDFGLNK